MKTAVRRVLLMSALLAPGALYALGLGEIKLNSALNQPFDAEIELVSANQEDLGALRAALASSDTFVRYGLDRPAFLVDFNFRVAKGSDGRDVLRVTSPRRQHDIAQPRRQRGPQRLTRQALPLSP